MNQELSNIALLFLRIASAGTMLIHGIPKVGKLFDGSASSFLNPIGIGSTPTLVLCVIAEVICPVLLIAGVLTRPAALILVLNMCAALIFHYQTNSPFVGGAEIAFLYLVMYLTILIAGGGEYTVSKLISKN